MKASDYIAAFLADRGVSHVFELSGGMITHLLDSVQKARYIHLVSMHHEQGAAFAADAYGRMTGIPGVAMATSGPGATNLLTGIGSCFFDSSPSVFITGQVNRHEQRGQRAIRQLGFQETDIVPMAAPITKAAWKIEDAQQLPEALARAFYLATFGRPGPVLLDIPMDVQRAEVLQTNYPGFYNPEPESSIDYQPLADALAKAKRPLILAGGGIASSRAGTLFRQFVDQSKIPVVNSLMGVDVLPFAHPLRVGMIGSYGNRWANLALGRSDLLIVLGSRLDVRQTGSETQAFKGEKTIFHVDVEPGEINNRVPGCTAIVSELKRFLKGTSVLGPSSQQWLEWKKEIAELRAQWPDVAELKNVRGINPNQFLHDLSRSSVTASAFVVDVGQHQMWAAQSVELQEGQRFLTSGGMGSMGFSLPAAVGASFSSPQNPIVLIAGDGGFQCNIQELQTIVRNRLPVKMVVLNNECHGMVRQFQESYFEGRYTSTLWGYSVPDFVKVGEAYGIPSHRVSGMEGIPSALEWLWQDPHLPSLLEVKIDTYANAYPKIAFGHPITEMEPFAKPLEMEGT